MKIDFSFKCKIGGSWHRVEVIKLRNENIIVGSKSKGIVCIKNNQERFLPIYDLENWIIEGEKLYLKLSDNQIFSIEIQKFLEGDFRFNSEVEFPYKRKEENKYLPTIDYLESPVKVLSYDNFWIVIYPQKGIDFFRKKDLSKTLHFNLPIYCYIDDAFIYDNKIFLADVLGLRILKLELDSFSNLLQVNIDETYAINKGWPKDVAVKDNLILVADVFGIKIYDKKELKLLGKWESEKNRIAKVIVKNNLVFLSCEAFGVKIVDIFHPTLPKLCGAIFLPKGCWDAYIVENYLYMAGYTEGLFRANLSNLKNITVENVFKSGEEVIGVYGNADYIFTACSYSGIKIFNKDLKLTAEYKNISGRCWTVVGKDNLVFTACGKGGVEIFDFYNEKGLKKIAHIKTKEARDLVIEDEFLYIADGQNGVLIYNVANPFTPQFVRHIPSSAFTRGVMVDRDYIYKADGDGGVEIYGR